MSWPTIPLGEAVTFKGGGTPSKEIGAFWNGPIPWATVKDLNNGYVLRSTQESISEEGLKRSASNLIPTGTVIIPTRMALGKAVITEMDVAINQDLKAVLPEVNVDSRFLMWFFIVNGSKIEAMGKGATVKGVTLDQLKRLQFPVPPLPEQRRIAAILDKADALRAKRREAIAKLDQLLQSVFLDMFGDPVMNPKGWHAQKSASLFRDKPRIGTTRPATGSGIVVVRVGEIGGDEIDFQRCSRAELEQDEVERYSLAPGDTVIARAIGSKEQLGKCSYFAGSSETVCIDSHVMRLRPDPERCDPLWFNFLLRSPGGKRLLQSKGGATAVQFNINTTQVSDLDVPLPPIELQRRFSNAFSHVRVQKQLHSESERGFDNMFGAVQQQAFSGNL